MNKAYLLTGGNIGDRAKYLAQARERISNDCGRITGVSSLFETEAWGKTDQSAFLNQALEIQTRLGPEELIRCILNVEKKMGRVRQEKYGARVIDIDVLFFNDTIYKSASLEIPHPQIQYRRFVLAPLAEIAPDIKHPVLQQTVAELLRDCSDPLAVKKYSNPKQ